LPTRGVGFSTLGGGGAGDERAASVAAGLVEQGRAGGEVVDDRGAEAAVEGGGERKLVALLDLELARQRAGAAGGAGVGAQELVDGGELGAHPGGLAARGLDAALGLAPAGPGGLRGGVGLRPGGGLDPDVLGRRLGARGGLGVGGLQRLELALELGLALGVEALELVLELLDALAARLVGGVGGLGGAERLELLGVGGDALADRRRGRGGLLGAQLDALGARRGRRRPAGQRLAPLGALGQRLLGGLAARGDLGERLLGVGLQLVRLGGRPLGDGQPRPPRPRGVARQLPARLDGLALEPLVQLGGLGLALERPQPRARLALDVERPVEVVLRALELELRAAPALAVLAQPGGLLDQQPAVLGLGGDDRLDAALGDDGVHLLAQARVGEDLEHVDHPALRAVEPVLALAVAVQAPEDRDLAHRQVDGAVAVVEHELDLGRRARLHAAAAAKMTSCIDWPRTASGDCSPIAHSTRRSRWTCPSRSGPTTTEMPVPNSSRVRSGTT
jgi:hypothetical protein